MYEVRPTSVAFSHRSHGTRPSSASSTSAAIGRISRAAKSRREPLQIALIIGEREVDLAHHQNISNVRFTRHCERSSGACEPATTLRAMSAPAPTGATAFDGTQRAYERARPTYAIKAVLAALLLAGVDDVGDIADLGAGTGKLTRVLLPHAQSIVAIEPSPAMRAAFQQAVPDVEVRDGRAEAIPLPDASVDLIAVGEAFHWFRPAPRWRRSRASSDPQARSSSRTTSGAWTRRPGSHRPTSALGRGRASGRRAGTGGARSRAPSSSTRRARRRSRTTRS